MLDIGWGEMLVIAVIMIVVVGPKELPGMLRTFGRTTSKLRVMAGDFRKQFDEALKEAELDDLKKVADDVRALNPKNEIRKALSPMEKAAEDVRAGLDACRDARRSRACRTGGDTRDWGIGVSCGEDGSEKAGSSKKACHGKENRYREGGGLA
jgi:sec-independent protein translocase protein TatB